jgi:hypothetical protein
MRVRADPCKCFDCHSEQRPLSFGGARHTVIPRSEATRNPGCAGPPEKPDFWFNRIFPLYLQANRYNQSGPQPLRIVTKKFCSFATENQFAQLSCGETLHSNATH